LVLAILKSPEIGYNANSLAKHLGLSSMGALKIVKRLEEENILISRKVGQANIYSINFKGEYARQYIRFLLKKDANDSSPYIRRWIRELEKIKSADGITLFGSVMNKEDQAKDIDVLVVVNQKNFNSVKKEIESINMINEKKIHPIYQSKEDIKKNISDGDKVILNAIKGIILSGDDVFMEILQR
jgi:predicted nucleotidyltransferase